MNLQALAGEVGMSAELDEVAKSLFNGNIPSIWRVLAPATLKSLGNWMIHFLKRNEQYVKWVRQWNSGRDTFFFRVHADIIGNTT